MNAPNGPAKTVRDGAGVIVDYLIREKVPYVFGLCGHGNIGFIDALHARGFECAVETNGTLEAPAGLDWITVSPKSIAPVKLHRASELKLVYPQPTALPERFAAFDAAHFFLQPMDGPRLAENTRAAVEYCKAHPHWRLSLQTHKYLGIP